MTTKMLYTTTMANHLNTRLALIVVATFAPFLTTCTDKYRNPDDPRKQQSPPATTQPL